GSEESLAVSVKIQAPGVAGPLRENIKLPLYRIVAPHGGVQPYFPDLGLRENAVQAIKPAVRPPLHRIQCLMRILAAETAEQDLAVIAMSRSLGVLEKEKVRRGSQKDAAVSDFDAAGQIERW